MSRQLAIVSHEIVMGLPCFSQRKASGYVLENGIVLMESERDGRGRYKGGAGMDGMYLQASRRFEPARDAEGVIVAFIMDREEFHMPKPAEGQSGAQMGTTAYVQHLNQASGIAAYLPDLGGCDYLGAIQTLASRARGIIDAVYGDLQMHWRVLRYISKGKRENLSSLIQRLEDICALAGADAGKARECRSMLSLGGFAGMSSSMSTDSDLEKGVSLIRGGGQSGLDNFLRAATVKEAAQWGETFAAGSDLIKKAFLNELTQRQSTGYLKDVWDLYSYQQNPDGYCGANAAPSVPTAMSALWSSVSSLEEYHFSLHKQIMLP